MTSCGLLQLGLFVNQDWVDATLYVKRNKKKLLFSASNSVITKQNGLHVREELCPLRLLLNDTVLSFRHSLLVFSLIIAHVYRGMKSSAVEFSVSPRISTSLTVLSGYQVNMRDIAGSAILPSDFASPNATECLELSRQVCKFSSELEECVVNQVNLQDILASRSFPFTIKAE